MAQPKISLKGQFLLDSGQLQGSYFQRTVVLVCQHDAEGAFGLVVNRPTDTNAGDVIAGEFPEALKQCRLYEGGPVQPTALSYLHSGLFLPDGNVIANLNLGHSLETLSEIADSFSPTNQVKLFAGYAGWSPGQLDDEMKRNAWLTHPASLELVFDTEPAALWAKILRLKGGQYRLLAQAPEDLSSN
jgi:putative transcriptional regulator